MRYAGEIGPIFLEAARFCFAMALMLHSGMTMEESLDMAAPVLPGLALQTRLSKLRASLTQNASMADALHRSGLLSAMDARLIQVGSRVGAVDTAMDSLAERLEVQTDEALQAAVALCEPVLVGLMAGVASMILLSVMLPLMGIMAAL